MRSSPYPHPFCDVSRSNREKTTVSLFLAKTFQPGTADRANLSFFPRRQTWLESDPCRTSRQGLDSSQAGRRGQAPMVAASPDNRFFPYFKDLRQNPSSRSAPHIRAGRRWNSGGGQARKNRGRALREPSRQSYNLPTLPRLKSVSLRNDSPNWEKKKFARLGAPARYVW
jgi:hypothetical protein